MSQTGWDEKPAVVIAVEIEVQPPSERWLEGAWSGCPLHGVAIESPSPSSGPPAPWRQP